MLEESWYLPDGRALSRKDEQKWSSLYKWLTVNPALCNLNAIRSRKLTNWLKTMLLVVASCIRKLLSSSTNASIFEEDRQVSRFRRPRMPWRAFGRFSSSSRAGASKSIVSGRWHTGHAGCFQSDIGYMVDK